MLEDINSESGIGAGLNFRHLACACRESEKVDV